MASMPRTIRQRLIVHHQTHAQAAHNRLVELAKGDARHPDLAVIQSEIDFHKEAVEFLVS